MFSNVKVIYLLGTDKESDISEYVVTRHDIMMVYCISVHFFLQMYAAGFLFRNFHFKYFNKSIL